MKPNFFACCVKPCYLASSCLTHLPLVCGSIEYIYTVLKLLHARAFVLSLNTSSALKSLVCASCHSQEGPQNLACVVSPNFFPILYSPATHSFSSFTDKLSPSGTLPRLFPLPLILFSLFFIHRTTNPSGLSCWVSFPRVSSPSPEIPLGISLISDFLASCNFLHADYPPVVITESLECYSQNVWFITLISVPATVPGT